MYWSLLTGDNPESPILRGRYKFLRNKCLPILQVLHESPFLREQPSQFLDPPSYGGGSVWHVHDSLILRGRQTRQVSYACYLGREEKRGKQAACIPPSREGPSYGRRRRSILRTGDPTPPPCFPSYAKACWAFAQLRIFRMCHIGMLHRPLHEDDPH